MQRVTAPSNSSGTGRTIVPNVAPQEALQGAQLGDIALEQVHEEGQSRPSFCDRVSSYVRRAFGFSGNARIAGELYEMPVPFVRETYPEFDPINLRERAEDVRSEIDTLLQNFNQRSPEAARPVEEQAIINTARAAAENMHHCEQELEHSFRDSAIRALSVGERIARRMTLGAALDRAIRDAEHAFVDLEEIDNPYRITETHAATMIRTPSVSSIASSNQEEKISEG